MGVGMGGMVDVASLGEVEALCCGRWKCVALWLLDGPKTKSPTGTGTWTMGWRGE